MNNLMQVAIEAAGSQEKLAALLGTTQPTISRWKTRRVPACHVLSVERITGGKVTRYQLRPDLYGVAP